LRSYNSAGAQGVSVKTSVFPLMGAVLELEELEEKVRGLEQSKQDKPGTENITVSQNDLTRGKLQAKQHQILSSAGDKEPEVALKIHLFLSSLE
jgi:hypothetical protein